VTARQLNQTSPDHDPPARALSRTEFASAVTAITSAFGDPTRRDIYLQVGEAADGLTATQVADATGLHPNVARHHLDKLVAGGYLEVGTRASSGAGRPAKVYRATGPMTPLEVNVGHDDILITLLGKALSRLGDAEAAALAEEVGLEYGRTMAKQMGDLTEGQRSFRTALHVVADALSAHGFSAHAERHGDELRIVSSHCPFGDVAIEHPVICAVDRGMVQGLLGSLYGETEVALTASMARGDDACVTDVQST
jgi:predicted ArsR family transcriptional regulator